MINSQLNNPIQLLEDAARQIGATVENNSLVFNGSANEGLVQLFTLEEGLTMVLTEIKSNLSLSKLQLKMPEDYLFIKLYLPDFQLETIARTDVEHYQISTPGVLLYNSYLELKSLFKVQERFKIVSFAMHADWLRKTLDADSSIAKKELFEAPFFMYENVTPAVLQSALNLFTLKADTAALNLRMKSIVYDILSELFLTFDGQKSSALSASKYQDDIDAVFKIREQLLDLKDTKYPTIDILAKQAAMSPSKLKTVFRSVFGMSIFEFYQHHRLTYARHLIIARKLTIGEIGLKIGYNNLSKFSQAYKKQFGYLPNQTL